MILQRFFHTTFMYTVSHLLFSVCLFPSLDSPNLINATLICCFWYCVGSEERRGESFFFFFGFRYYKGFNVTQNEYISHPQNRSQTTKSSCARCRLSHSLNQGYTCFVSFNNIVSVLYINIFFSKCHTSTKANYVVFKILIIFLHYKQFQLHIIYYIFFIELILVKLICVKSESDVT